MDGVTKRRVFVEICCGIRRPPQGQRQRHISTLPKREAPGEPDIGDEITGAWSTPPELLSNADGTGILNIERDNTTGIITVTFTDGRTQLFSVSDGRDGKTLERIFIRTQDVNTPADPVSESAIDDYVPDGSYG